MKNPYESKQKLKYFFIASALLIAIVSILVTNRLVRKLAEEERKKVETLGEANKLMSRQVLQDISEEESNQEEDPFTTLFVRLTESNATVPLIMIGDSGQLIQHKNIDAHKLATPESTQKLIREFKAKNPPIEIKVDDSVVNYLYYDESTVLKQLQVFPYIQLGVVFVFIVISFLALSSSKKAEQNKVWVGLSKETAHQLGTPISSLMAWVEYLKIKSIDPALLEEIDKDVQRLKTIAERFSKIGSDPENQPMDLNVAIRQSIDYMSKRISSKVSIQCHFPDEPILVMMNDSLFGWVIENLIKNAVDAMNGQGKINFFIEETGSKIKIDVSDTGKGISKSKFEAVFQPGYTTKKRGWGLGLSLVRRIIESYQHGKIFILRSEQNKGTTFRIELRKYIG